jgi:hypothetical protein
VRRDPAQGAATAIVGESKAPEGGRSHHQHPPTPRRCDPSSASTKCSSDGVAPGSLRCTRLVYWPQLTLSLVVHASSGDRLRGKALAGTASDGRLVRRECTCAACRVCRTKALAACNAIRSGPRCVEQTNGISRNKADKRRRRGRSGGQRLAPPSPTVGWFPAALPWESSSSTPTPSRRGRRHPVGPPRYSNTAPGDSVISTSRGTTSSPRRSAFSIDTAHCDRSGSSAAVHSAGW